MAVFDNALIAAGKFVKSINPSLVEFPPPSSEVTGNDICYLGPGGDDEVGVVTYCRDLQEGKRALVGSWFVHPERHALEYIICNAICVMVIMYLVPRLPQYPEHKRNQLMPPPWMKFLSIMTLAMQTLYKICGYSGKIYFLLMPCNLMLTMWAVLSLAPNWSTNTLHACHQVIFSITILAYAAIAAPDLEDLLMFCEIPFFFIMHIELISFTIYFHYGGRISMLPYSCEDSIASYFVKWWILSIACFGLFYFGVGVPLSLVSGMNINYMLSPPQTPGDIISGPNYRLMTGILLAGLFFLIRLFATILEMSSKKMFLMSIRSRRMKKAI